MATRPAGQQQHQTEGAAPTEVKEILLSALPPLQAGIRVLGSLDPIKATRKETHSWFGTFVALSLTMLLGMLVLLASDGAPFVDPWTSIWTSKFELNVKPEVNWSVMLLCSLYAFCACAFAFFASWLAGLHLSRGANTTRTPAVRLAGYAAIGVAFSYLAMLLLIFALGWILYAFNFRIFVVGWMTMAAVVTLPITTWGIAKVFRRTSLPLKTSILAPLAVSVATITGCLIASALIEEALMKSLLSQGRTVNSVRRTPTSAVVQTCARVSADIACAITLFPTKWQDYELIGDWKLGSVTNADGDHRPHLYWRPVTESDRQFALVTLESPKEVTVEIRTTASLACKSGGTNVAQEDQFFSVRGRVLGQQHNAPQEMRLRIDNAEQGFLGLMKDACLTQAST